MIFKSCDTTSYEFLAEYGIINPSLLRIKTGRNSKVWKVGSPNGQWILKEYHSNPNDIRDRLGTEFRFLKFLYTNGIQNISEPLAFHKERNLGLYRFLPGASVHTISDGHIHQAADFICAE